ncbi:hypothetical protein [Clostridium cochlearium]|uniref:Uncharacterized protein n=1 Tax=Clostridium cochlearium TaxID=1494 RepID=A0A7Y3Y0P1_CLOCO|nr:hypothetical protein [Clostridium cochlearium]NOH17275.1 hypothetical protein [Clostridium cochlearium]
MKKRKVRHMQGVPASLEYIRPKEIKRKEDCIYYENNICKNNKIQTYLFKCVGYKICVGYIDIYPEGFKDKKEKEKIRKQRIIGKKYTLLDMYDR